MISYYFLAVSGIQTLRLLLISKHVLLVNILNNILKYIFINRLKNSAHVYDFSVCKHN